MKPIDAHARFAALCDSKFKGWQLPDADPALVLQPDWPLYATSFCSLTGELGDLPDAPTDNALLDLCQRGWSLFQMGALTEEQVEAEADAVMQAVAKWGDEIQNRIDVATKNN